MGQTGGKECPDQLGNCDWSPGEEVPGGGEVRGAEEGSLSVKDGVAQGQEGRKSAPGAENSLGKDGTSGESRRQAGSSG